MKDEARISEGAGLSPRAGALAAAIFALAAWRLVPHPYNATPVAAMALFGGAQLASRRWAVAVPLCAMLLSDLALELLFGHGLHRLLPVVYLCLVATVALGALLRRRRSVWRIAGASVAASVMFFAVTNFFVWRAGGLYPPSAGGLVACYAAALPFFGNTVAGDLIFTVAIFGAWAAAERRWPVLAPAKAAA